MDEGQLVAELSTLTGLTPEELRDILRQPPEVMREVLENYRDMDWTQPGTPLYLQVVSVLEAAGGLASAVAAIAALRSL